MKTYFNRVLSSVTTLSILAVSFAGALSIPTTAFAAGYSIPTHNYSIVGQTLYIDGTSAASPQTGANAGQKMAVDWDTDKDGDPTAGTSVWQNSLTFNRTFFGGSESNADGFNATWTGSHDYAAFGGGTYRVKVIVYHTKPTGNDGSDLSTFEFTVVIPDTGAPVVTVTPSAQTIEATGPSGAIANFTATALDAVDGPLTPTCDQTSGAAFPLGTTVVTCSATDSANNTGTDTGSITVVDTTPPVITVAGSDPVDLHVGDSYSDDGATATDLVDGTDPVTTGGDTVNTSVPGTYTITYDSVDNAGNHAVQKTRVVTVSDVAAPVVTVTPPTQTVEATGPTGAVATFDVSATDDADGDLSGSVTCDATSGSIFALGNTTVSCSVTDSSNNTGNGAGTIAVVDTTPPVITLIGDATINLLVGEAYADAGATAADIVDVTDPVTTGGDTVDTSIAGTYVLTFDAVDNAGNHATQVTRTVIVSNVPPADLCSNIEGVQNPVPDGLVANEDGTCTEPVQPPADLCNNIDGVQAMVPEGMVANDGVCTAPPTPTDVCSNLEGIQESLPSGYVVNDGVCEEQRSSGGGSRSGSRGGSVLGASTGEVLGASCGLYMDRYLKLGAPTNDEVQVIKLQAFLNTQGLFNRIPSGVFDMRTHNAVKDFQEKYFADILTPWGLTGPTGLVYLTTLHKINMIECPGLMLTVPALTPWTSTTNTKFAQ